jgi:hypothetical protein
LVCCLLKWMMVSVKMANVAGTWINVETLQLEKCELIISLQVSMNTINRIIYFAWAVLEVQLLVVFVDLWRPALSVLQLFDVIRSLLCIFYT